MVKLLIKKIIKLFKNLVFKLFTLAAYFIPYLNKNIKNSKGFNIGFIVEEFFHHDLRGFGGFGKTVKNISDYFNLNINSFNVNVILTDPLPIALLPTIKRFHNADVLFRPASKYSHILNYFKYIKLINLTSRKLFISIDYYPSYEYPLLASPATPLLIWIKDPRSKVEWHKIGGVSSELMQHGKNNIKELLELANEKRNSIDKIIKLSKVLKRKIIFATQANFLIERAERTYGIQTLKPYLLHNPISLQIDREIKYSQKPSLVFLGRLDPVKRPWIFFELARRFKDIDFYIAGATHVAYLMDSVIEKYKKIENLKFLGNIFDKEKNEILEKCWAVVNTSIHESLPVSFLEAFSFGKCVISCQSPDNLVEKFGFFTGEVLGEGLDKQSLDIFSEQIEKFLSNKDERLEKGRLAKEYVEKNHNFVNYQYNLCNILSKEGIYK